MKKQILCIASALMLTVIPSFAQSNNNVDEVVKIERHNAQAFREGEMIVKFKPIAPVRIKSLNKSVTSGVNAVDRVLSELGVTASEPLMPLTGGKVIGTKTLKSVTGKTLSDSDMSLLYRFQFDSQKMDVHQAVEKLSTLSEVEFAEPNYVVYTLSSDGGDNLIHHDDHDHYCNEPLYSEQWGHQPLKMPFLWQQPKLSNKRPIIAIIDTGVDITHPDLVDNIWTNEAELNGAEGEDDDANGFKDDVHGWDFVNQTARLGDWNGHGTHCAGIAAAVGRNGIGVTGANPDALIMPITVMQSDGTGDVATIIKGIDYAAANGADVISMSIGGYGYSIAEEQALAKAYSKAVLVAAAGNDFKCIYAHDCPINKKKLDENGPMYPAAFTFVLGVEASVSGGSLASFSNFDEDGPVFSAYNEEQLYNYELRAPGYSIMSTFPGGRYKKLNGTSMACPFVAGGVSRLLQCKEYTNWEILFGDLIHTRKKNGLGDVDFEAAYKLTDADRQPSLGLVTYVLKDTIEGDGDGRPDAGETIAFYPTLRNEWGQAQNIRFCLELGELEDSTIVEFLDAQADFGKPLSSYGKNISANPLRFRVNPECVDGRHIRMVLRATCDNIAEEMVQEFTLTAENGVEIGGMIMEDMTLYPNVHYIVTKTLVVPEGIILTILPGTILKFKEGCGLALAANTLVCKGTPDSPIIFTEANLTTSGIGEFNFQNNKIEWVIFENIYTNKPFSGSIAYAIRNVKMENCMLRNMSSSYIVDASSLFLSNIYASIASINILAGQPSLSYVNFCGNIINDSRTMESLSMPVEKIKNSNLFSNQKKDILDSYSIYYQTNNISLFKPSAPNYLGSSRKDIVRYTVLDYENPISPVGLGVYDLSNMLTRPSADAHALVWKVVVNGYDAQDEFEQIPPLGVGKHKFEVYFSRPMDKSFTPMLTMGVRPPYTSHTIAEDGSWNEDGTIYTAYLTITGKTDTDGLNRIYVADAVENFEDYYLREDLKNITQKTSVLFQNVLKNANFVKLALQESDETKDGFLTGKVAGGVINRIIDKDEKTYIILGYDGNILVDLGENNEQRFIKLKLLASSREYSIQGSNDGISFNDILVNLEKEFITQDASRFIINDLLVDAGSIYRYYRIIASESNVSGGGSIYELELEVPQNREILNEEFPEEFQCINYADSLSTSRCRDNELLKSTIAGIYEKYNKIAVNLSQPTIDPKLIEVPSAPAWVIPVEKSRFNVQVAAAGSMSTGLMAEAGLGKVNLTWETDEEDFADLLGYNIMRYTDHVDSLYVKDFNKYGDNKEHLEIKGDTTIINSTVLDTDATSYTDYDVVPGTTYYYVIKQLTTSLNTHALSNAVAATPLTAQKGDANGSMSVDIADVVTEVAYITYQNPQPFIFEAADVNDDEKVNVLDVVGTIGIITTPKDAQVNGMDNEPVRYYVHEGILYLENEQPLGGVQVRFEAEAGTEIVTLEALKGMEQTHVWTGERECLFLAYSMSGRTLAPGKHALLQIGNGTKVLDMVLSDAKGQNVCAIDYNTTGIGKVEAMQLQMPSPNPFTTVLNVPYVIGKDGNHAVSIVFTDITGRQLDAYHTTATRGNYTYTWRPNGLNRGVYLVSLYVDGKMMQSVKVICVAK